MVAIEGSIPDGRNRPSPRAGAIGGTPRSDRRDAFADASASAIVAATTTLALATFGFQTAQVWAAESSDRRGLRWVFPVSISVAVLFLGAAAYLGYWVIRSTARITHMDPYLRYAYGILAYGELLHRENRDPALLRLRHSSSLTLHVLGFHSERVLLGTWALESAQFLDDSLSTMEVLMDDLGWGNYLLGKSDVATANIRKAIEYGHRMSADVGGPRRSLLLAKAYRHLGVIETAKADRVYDAGFRNSRTLLEEIRMVAPAEVSIDLAHVDHAEALAIVSMLRLNRAGSLRRGDEAGEAHLRKALNLARRARDQFYVGGDQGRFAKSLVLEVRILEAVHENAEAAQLALLRDRAVAASVWARPSGAVFITGR